LNKRGKSDVDVLASLEYLRQLIEPVDCELYGEFEAEARERLRGRDENDWPLLATALGLGCDIWTEDQDFFGTGIGIWTTNRIEIFLKSQTNRTDAEQW
jgi:predicted nucleic acid-binding protein